MAITLQPVPRFDTRGLPEGMDPEQLFRYRYDTLSKDAKGVESFLYKYMPYDLVKSFAFAIDPTYRYKVAPGTITAANRTKYRSTASVLQYRQSLRTRSLIDHNQETNYKGHSFCGSPYLVYNSIPIAPVTAVLSTQPVLVDRINDTTSRTRIFGSHQGELEMFKSVLLCPGRSHEKVIYTRTYYNTGFAGESCRADGGTTAYETGTTDTTRTTYSPSAATLSSSTLSSLRTSEIALCKELSAHHAISLLKGVSPFTRDYSLSRNVAELKDLARSMISARRTADDLKQLWSSLSSSKKTRDNVFDLTSTNLKNIPSEYLSFHFGWKQLYKDLRDLVALPEKLSRRINFLILRSGKPSTYRAKRLSLSGSTSVSGFVYDVDNHDHVTLPGNGTRSRIQRKHETRLVIGATFDFPPANTPQFRTRFFLDKIGLIPRFTDVYNILPWSWLVDWFTGFGNYLELIEEINHDPLLINWGVITTRTSGELITEFSTATSTRRIIRVDGVLVEDSENWIPSHHTSILEFECQTRQNVASVLDVNETTIRTSLSSYQLSILGALLAQRIDDTRPGAFRPRS